MILPGLVEKDDLVVDLAAELNAAVAVKNRNVPPEFDTFGESFEVEQKEGTTDEFVITFKSPIGKCYSI